MSRRYSAPRKRNGVPFAAPAGDLDAIDSGGGDCDFGDLTIILGWIGPPGTYDVRGDLDGDVDASDQSTLTGTYSGVSLGRGKLSRGVDLPAGGIRKGYAGYEHDGALLNASFMHVRHRVYMAEIGRWTRRDPLGYVDVVNLFEYVGSKPVQHIDPIGLSGDGGVIFSNCMQQCMMNGDPLEALACQYFCRCVENPNLPGCGLTLPNLGVGDPIGTVIGRRPRPPQPPPVCPGTWSPRLTSHSPLFGIIFDPSMSLSMSTSASFTDTAYSVTVELNNLVHNVSASASVGGTVNCDSVGRLTIQPAPASNAAAYSIAFTRLVWLNFIPQFVLESQYGDVGLQTTVNYPTAQTGNVFVTGAALATTLLTWLGPIPNPYPGINLPAPTVPDWISPFSIRTGAWECRCAP